MASPQHRRTLLIGLGIAVAALGAGPGVSAAAAADDRWPVDVFATGSADHWTAVRNVRGVRLAVSRLSAAGDVALVTWAEFGQFWCGLAIPESDCKGGRWFVIVGRPGALPERFARKTPLDSSVPIAIAIDGGRPIREIGMDMTEGVYVRGGADLPVGKHVHAFQFSVDYEKAPGFARSLRRCRTISVLVAGRRHTFGCAGLRSLEASD
jgi:hypothetical protein